jgi:hypothetical protein
MTRKNLNQAIKEQPKSKEELLEIYKLKDNEIPALKMNFHEDVKNFILDRRITDKVIKTKLKPIYNMYVLLHSKINSLLKSLNSIRTLIKKNRTPELYKLSTYEEHFNIPKSERKARAEKYKKINVERNNSPMRIDLPEIIEKLNELLEKLNELLDSKHKYELGSGLLLASGVRPIELMCKANFKIDEDNKNNVIVDGLAKKRAGMTDTVSRPIIGLSPSDFIDKVKLFRDTVKNPCQKSEAVSRGLQRAFKAKFPEISKQGRFLFTRKIYSELAFQKYAPEELRTNKPLYLAQILGHAEGDIQTAQAYSWIKS